MAINRIAQDIEIKFWKMIMPVLEDEGMFMKTITTIKHASRSKLVNIAVLLFVWAAIGFVSGLIIGRFIMIFQLF